MAGTMKRSQFQGVWTVLRFNWHLHVFAMVFLVGLLVMAHHLTGTPRLLAHLMTAGAFLQLIISFAATWIAYDASRLYQFSWLAPILAGSERGANLHAGFDETTRLLRSSFPSIEWQVFDFYDPAAPTQISIRRARRAHPPETGTIPIRTDAIPMSDASLDVAILFLAAHEIRDSAERVHFFRELNRVLKPGGRLIVTEHLRDAPNIFAYSIGAWHFHPRSEWLTTFQLSGFHIVREFRNNPFITTFVLTADENAA